MCHSPFGRYHRDYRTVLDLLKGLLNLNVSGCADDRASVASASILPGGLFGAASRCESRVGDLPARRTAVIYWPLRSVIEGRTHARNNA